MATRTTAKRLSKPAAKPDPAPILSSNAHCYDFPAIRGIQAGKEFYTGMIPVRLLKKLFVFDSEEVPPELRAQRILNESRAHKIRDYIIENPSTYVFNSVTVMIDYPDLGNMEFIPVSEVSEVGSLRVSMDAKFLICDGQHRVKGCSEAYEQDGELGDETLPVVFFRYTSLERAQQVFSDLNNRASKPNSSISLLYDHRDSKADVTRAIIQGVEVFKRFTDMERTSIAAKSSKLFTINGIDAANKELFLGTFLPFEEQIKIGIRFWNAVFNQMKDWQDVLNKKVAAFDVRQNSISGHAVTLVAIGIFGNKFIGNLQKLWNEETAYQIEALSVIDWERTSQDWQDLIIFNNKIDKSKKTCAALSEYIRSHIAKIVHPIPDLSGVDTSSEKYKQVKEYIRTRLTEMAVGVSFRDTNSTMPLEYKALLELEEEGYCTKFIDNGWQIHWKIPDKKTKKARA